LDLGSFFRYGSLEVRMSRSETRRRSARTRECFIDGEVARRFFERVLAAADERRLLSAEHFSVEGTPIQAWASLKSFRPKKDEIKNPARLLPSTSLTWSTSLLRSSEAALHDITMSQAAFNAAAQHRLFQADRC
jgi:hypothetical protein